MDMVSPSKPSAPRAMSPSKRSSGHAHAKSHSAALHDARLTVKATNVAREQALAFLDADANGDGALDFEEVRGMQPAHARCAHSIRALYTHGHSLAGHRPAITVCSKHSLRQRSRC